MNTSEFNEVKARLAAFENRVFAKYAAAHRLPFLDVARLMPRDPDLFVDAIHNTETGVRLQVRAVADAA